MNRPHGRSTGRRRLAAALSAALVAALAALVGGGAPAAGAAGAYPTSMSALGDSITRGFNAAGWFVDWPSRSWATGTDADVDSHYARLRALDAAITGRAYNDARTGATMAALAGQAQTSVAQGTEYVTVLMGANDACADTEDQMTTVPAFRTRFRAGMDVLATQRPRPKVLVASIPDLRRLWRIGKDSAAARTAWSSFGICQSMLARPRSTDPADVDRRARVRQRVIDFNAALAGVCATYAFCRYDGGAVFGYPFTLSQVSHWDYFHPNTAGQAALADVTWQAGFWGASAPVAAATAR